MSEARDVQICFREEEDDEIESLWIFLGKKNKSEKMGKFEDSYDLEKHWKNRWASLRACDLSGFEAVMEFNQIHTRFTK